MTNDKTNAEQEVSGTTFHLQASIEGLLDLTNNQLSKMFVGNGSAIRLELLERKARGEKFIGAEDCGGFDPFEKGCPGHKNQQP